MRFICVYKALGRRALPWLSNYFGMSWPVDEVRASVTWSPLEWISFPTACHYLNNTNSLLVRPLRTNVRNYKTFHRKQISVKFEARFTNFSCRQINLEMALAKWWPFFPASMWLVNSPHQLPVKRKMFPCDDVIMTIPQLSYKIIQNRVMCVEICQIALNYGWARSLVPLIIIPLCKVSVLWYIQLQIMTCELTRDRPIVRHNYNLPWDDLYSCCGRRCLKCHFCVICTLLCKLWWKQSQVIRRP